MPKDEYSVSPINSIDIPALNRAVNTVNDALRTAFLRIGQLEGRDGGKPTLKSDLDLGGHDLKRVGRIILERSRSASQWRSVEVQTTSFSVADPADAPASADVLRDDLVANTLPDIVSALEDLRIRLNLVVQTLKQSGLL